MCALHRSVGFGSCSLALQPAPTCRVAGCGGHVHPWARRPFFAPREPHAAQTTLAPALPQRPLQPASPTPRGSATPCPAPSLFRTVYTTFAPLMMSAVWDSGTGTSAVDASQRHPLFGAAGELPCARILAGARRKVPASTASPRGTEITRGVAQEGDAVKVDAECMGTLVPPQHAAMLPSTWPSTAMEAAHNQLHQLVPPPHCSWLVRFASYAPYAERPCTRGRCHSSSSAASKSKHCQKPQACSALNNSQDR